mmetsp:Transcript_12874/g.14522  ORF Transcript_12874/g.14522 Transcript_12874/m.14522 type:complete len:181 (+) Transcript_12874:104-646(+)
MLLSCYMKIIYFVGDAAYTLSEQLLIPFTGTQRHNVNNDSFNYHLSQLRIRVEMAFGRLVNKFRILNRKLECKTNKANARISLACAHLHNFIIDQDVPEDEFNSEELDVDDLGVKAMSGAPLGMCYYPKLPENDFRVYPGYSNTRIGIVNYIQENLIRRPAHNVLRNEGRRRRYIRIFPS